MINREEDERVRKRDIAIGEDLALLSVEELEWRIGVLKGEIERLQAMISTKQASRTAADSVFKF